MLFSLALNERLDDIDVFAVHPGGIQTNLGRHLTEEQTAALIQRVQESSGGNFAFKTVEQGAATTCWTATDPDLLGKGGCYAEDCNIADVDDESPAGGVRSYALDGAQAEALWALSEQMVGETFTC